MNYGFVKVAAAVPHVQVADCFYNIDKIEDLMREASEKGVQIIAFPELSVTAYTCLDLFAQQTLINGAEAALIQLINNTADLDILTIVGVPLRTENRLINAAVVFQKLLSLGSLDFGMIILVFILMTFAPVLIDVITVWLKGIYARSLDQENPGRFTGFIDKLRK